MEACILHCDLCCIARLQVITEVLQNEKFWITWKNTELDFSLNTFFHEFHQAIISFQDSYCKLKIFLMEYFSSSKVAFMSGSELIIHCPKKKKKKSPVNCSCWKYEACCNSVLPVQLLFPHNSGQVMTTADGPDGCNWSWWLHPVQTVFEGNVTTQ